MDGARRSSLRGLPPDRVAVVQRRRILSAAPATLAERGGYERTVVRDVIECAGISRRTFYDQFESRADVFRTAYDESFEHLYKEVAVAYFAQERWAESVAAGVQAALECSALDPLGANMILIEPL